MVGGRLGRHERGVRLHLTRSDTPAGGVLSFLDGSDPTTGYLRD